MPRVICMGTVQILKLGIPLGMGDKYYLPLLLMFGFPSPKINSRTIAVFTQFHRGQCAPHNLRSKRSSKYFCANLKFWNTSKPFFMPSAVYLHELMHACGLVETKRARSIKFLMHFVRTASIF